MSTPGLPDGLSLPILYNSTGSSESVLLGAYCLSPPLDSCQFGPCPNSDVTGVGQQISLYISAFTFAFTFIYTPNEIRFASYAYLANIYSLMIAAIVAAARSELTRNDAVFVLVATSSPASAYLWSLALRLFVRLWRGKPLRKERYGFRSSIELLMMAALTILSLLLWISATCVILVPFRKVQFSQPACDSLYPQPFSTLLWPLDILVHFGGIGGIVASILAIQLWKARRECRTASLRDIPSPGPLVQSRSTDTIRERLADITIIQWSREAFLATFPNLATPPIAAAFLLIAQGSVAFESRILYMNSSIAFAILLLGLCHSTFRYRLSRHRFRMFAIHTIALVLLIGWDVVGDFFLWFPDHSVETIVLSVCCLRLCSTAGMSKRFTIITVLLYTISLLAAATFEELGLAHIQDPGALFGLQLSHKIVLPASWRAVPFAWWFFIWTIARYRVISASPGPLSGFWPFCDYAKHLWLVTIDRCGVLKFGIFISAPFTLWIAAANGSNPTKSTKITFGQLYALLFSLASLVPVVITIREKWRVIWDTVWDTGKSKPSPSTHEGVEPERKD